MVESLVVSILNLVDNIHSRTREHVEARSRGVDDLRDEVDERGIGASGPKENDSGIDLRIHGTFGRSCIEREWITEYHRRYNSGGPIFRDPKSRSRHVDKTCSNLPHIDMREMANNGSKDTHQVAITIVSKFKNCTETFHIYV